MSIIRKATATIDISANDTTSNAIFIGGDSLVGLRLPAALTSTSVTIHASLEADGTYLAMTDSAGAAVDITVAASKHVILLPANYSSANYIKVVTGSSEAADRAIEVLFRKVD